MRTSTAIQRLHPQKKVAKCYGHEGGVLPMQIDKPKERTENEDEASSISGIPQQPLFTVKETAEIFKVHVRTVERWIEEQCLSAIVLPGGKSLRVPYQEISKVFFTRRH
jgi:excisionase family DNA binding protein